MARKNKNVYLQVFGCPSTQKLVEIHTNYQLLFVFLCTRRTVLLLYFIHTFNDSGPFNRGVFSKDLKGTIPSLRVLQKILTFHTTNLINSF